MMERVGGKKNKKIRRLVEILNFVSHGSEYQIRSFRCVSMSPLLFFLLLTSFTTNTFVSLSSASKIGLACSGPFIKVASGMVTLNEGQSSEEWKGRLVPSLIMTGTQPAAMASYTRRLLMTKRNGGGIGWVVDGGK